MREYNTYFSKFMKQVGEFFSQEALGEVPIVRDRWNLQTLLPSSILEWYENEGKPRCTMSPHSRGRDSRMQEMSRQDTSFGGIRAPEA